MKDIREHQVRPKGNLAKRIIAAIAAVAMLGGVGYATATTAVAEDTSVTQTQTTEPQTEKTTDAGSNAATEGSSTDTGATAEGSSANSNEATEGSSTDANAATEGSSTDANAAVEGNDAENTDAEEEDPQADDTAATPVAEGDASTETGSQLLSETFKNSTFAESGNWETQGSACLTAATDSSKCTKTQDSNDIQGTNGQGYLQLTDNSKTQSGAVLYTQPVISKNGLHVTFDYYMYHTTSVGSFTNPADGISFFLTDGAATLSQTGAEGAGLGYATSDDDGIGTNSTRGQGVAQGVLGIGLDRFGNFSAQNASGSKSSSGAYDRVTGGEDCGQWVNPQGANSVTVRGKGATDASGKWTRGYCIVASQNISEKVSTGLDTGTATNSESDANGKTVDITIDPVTDENATQQHLTVKIGTTTVIDTDITRLPDSVKFGFSASTGADHQVQLIRGLNVYSVTKLSQLDLVKSVDKDKYPNADTHVFKVGDTVPYTFVVRNSGNTQLNDVKVTDPNITSITCPATTLKSNQQTVCSGTLTITADMVDKDGHFTNTATASATDSDGKSVTSPQASATINVNKPLDPPAKNKRIKKNDNGTYTVNVDVTGAESSSTITSSQPVDFTLVLDVSESMNEKLGNNITKLKALENAVNSFLDQAATINKAQSDSTKHIHVGLITFSSSAQVVSNLTDDLTSLETKVNSLQTTRGTRADLGLDKVNSITGVRSTAKQVVIFFTDGAPRSGDGSAAFEDSVAANAVKAAKNLKDAGKTIYSIGVVDGADPTDTSKNINKFLHAVSSNYPSATATYQNRNTTFTLGAGGNNGYYKVASDAAGLTKVFDEIQKSETTTSAYTNVKMEDTLSGYVELSDTNYTVTAKDASGNAVTLTEGTDYKLTYATKKFTVEFLKPLSHGVTYTLSYNVKPTQEAYDKYAANGYGDTVGDEGTDLDGNTSSSGKPGFHSNEFACLSYTADGVNHACADNPYPHPVIQVVSSTLHIEKQWNGDGEKPASIKVAIKQGDNEYKTVELQPDDNGNWSTDVIIPAGESKTYTITEVNPGNQWEVSYQHKVGDGNLTEGSEVTVPQSTTPQTATVIITNKQVLVTLPAGSITVKKKVVGTNTGRDFSFTMTATGDNADKVTWPKTDQSKSEVTISQVSQTQVKSATFGDALTFPAVAATYTFQVTEDKPADITGWRYDDSTQTVTVTVQYDEAQKQWTAVASPAEVTFTNHYIQVSVLPFTGGTTDRQWLLVGGGIAGMAALMIGAAGIWRGKKRLV